MPVRRVSCSTSSRRERGFRPISAPFRGETAPDPGQSRPKSDPRTSAALSGIRRRTSADRRSNQGKDRQGARLRRACILDAVKATVRCPQEAGAALTRAAASRPSTTTCPARNPPAPCPAASDPPATHRANPGHECRRSRGSVRDRGHRAGSPSRCRLRGRARPRRGPGPSRLRRPEPASGLRPSG